MELNEEALSGLGLKFPKPKKKKKYQGLKKTRLKSHYKPIPIEVKKAVLEQKGSLCFLGHCPVCGGQAEVGLKDDFHHFVHKGKGGQDIVLHLWPCRRECHDHMHDHPTDEREMFKEIEAAGHKVVWRIDGKKVNRV